MRISPQATALPRARRAATLLLVVTALVVPVRRAAADGCQEVGDPASEYNQLLQASTELFKADALPAALEKLAAAEAICAVNPQLSYVRGRIFAKQGDCKAALAEYQRARVHLEAGVVKVADDFVGKLEARVAECSLGQVQVACADEGVVLTVGASEQACPARFELPLGSASVAARKAGYQPWSKTIDVQPGEQRIEVPTLAALLGTLALTCPPEVTAVDVRSEDGSKSSTASCPGHLELEPGVWTLSVPKTDYLRKVEVRAERETQHAIELGVATSAPPIPQKETGGYGAAGLTLTLVGLAVAGGGVASYFVAAGQVEDIKNGCCTYAEAQDQQDTANLIHVLGLSGMGLGGALVVTGVILLAIPGDEGDADQAADVGLQLDPERVVVTFGGRF